MKISSLIDFEKIAEKIQIIITKGDVIFLYGEIGVGKTTFARLLINNYEFKNKKQKSEVLSPTFNIVFEYDINNIHIKHYDLYRLKDKEDINNLGMFENSENCITLIEWPELLNKKPLNRLDLFFKYTNDMKEITLTIQFNGRLKEYEF